MSLRHNHDELTDIPGFLYRGVCDEGCLKPCFLVAIQLASPIRPNSQLRVIDDPIRGFSVPRSVQIARDEGVEPSVLRALEKLQALVEAGEVTTCSEFVGFEPTHASCGKCGNYTDEFCEDRINPLSRYNADDPDAPPYEELQRMIEQTDERRHSICLCCGAEPYQEDSEEGEEQVQQLKLFHGTSWERAQLIRDVGFMESEDGCLGRGVYAARQEKALRFAKDGARHGGQYGGLVSLLITFKKPKYVKNDDQSWREEGHDACRADHTTASTNMEWCVKDRSQVRVLCIEKVVLEPIHRGTKRFRSFE